MGSLDVKAPSLKVKGPSRDVSLDVKAPSLGIRVKGPSCDVSLKVKAPSLKGKGPSCDVSLDVKAPSLEIKVKGPSCDVSLDVKAPSLKVKGPSCDVSLKVKGPSCDVSLKVKAPSLEVDLKASCDVDVDVKAPSLEAYVSLSLDGNISQEIAALEAKCLTPRENLPSPNHEFAAAMDDADHALAELAAEVSGIPIDQLPDAHLIKAAAKELFELMDADDSQFLSKDELIDACLMYDDRVPIEGIEDTFYAVEDEIEPDPQGLTFDHFYLWLVLMFGDCTNDEFESGTQEFKVAINAASQARTDMED